VLIGVMGWLLWTGRRRWTRPVEAFHNRSVEAIRSRRAPSVEFASPAAGADGHGRLPQYRPSRGLHVETDAIGGW